MAGAAVTISILANAQNAVNGFNKVGNEAEKTGGKLARMGGILKGAFVGIAVGASVAAVSGIKDAITAASDLSETVSKTRQVFGAASDDVLKFAETSAQALGQTKQQVLDAQATFGIFGKSAGLAGKDLSGFTGQLTTLATDLASFNNTSVEESIEAIGAALRGEAEPMRKYGVLLDDASMRQQALRMGLIKTTKQALTPQQKVLAAQALIMEQTKDAQGDFARTSGGLANQQRILKAEFQNMSAELGMAFLPAVTKAAQWLNKSAIPAFKNFKGALKGFKMPTLNMSGTVKGNVAGDLKSSLGGIGQTIKSLLSGPEMKGVWTNITAGFGEVVATYREYAAVLAPIISQVVFTISTTFQSLAPQIRTIMTTLGEIFRSGFAIIAQVVRLVITTVSYLWQKFGADILSYIRSAMSAVVGVLGGAFTIVKGLFNIVLGILKGDWSKAWDGVKQVMSGAVQVIVSLWNLVKAQFKLAVSVVGGLLKDLWSLIKSGWNSAMAATKQAVSDGVNAVVNSFRSLPGNIKSFFAAAGTWLVQAGKDVIQGLLNGISNMAGAVWDKAKEIANGIKDTIEGAMKIGSPSKVMAELGKFIGQGLVVGLSGTAKQVSATSKKLAKLVRDAFQGATETRLLNRISSTNKRLARLAKDRAKWDAQLAKPLEKLAEVQAQRKEVVDGVADSMVQSFRLVDEQAGTSLQSILKRSADALLQAQKFAQQLVTLKAKGLNANMLNELAEAGPAAGAATAKALAAASKTEVDQLNKNYTELARVSQAAGGTVGDAMYGVGLKAAQSIVDGLKAKRQPIIDEMTKLAKQLAKAIDKAIAGADKPRKGTKAKPAIGAKASYQTTAQVASGAKPNVTNIVVNVPVSADPAEVGRQVTKAISAYEVSVGRKYLVTPVRS
ncbi:phage-related protein [Catenuloplanes nepalensis]|uniref:Phage-related protein n=1 Tax=Catenuloplanes nepalensis TaxID=587533 RepID=A0ABT9MUV0_9ACTN|nr:hypothetical protein [Catenuloplanes nepalensis]MDP9795224.1 phage-related protein [Catenuloplanes nepalensis]